MDDTLDELAKFKVAGNGVVKEADKQAELVETNLMNAVTELKAHWCIFRALPSLEDLVNPPGKLEIGENPDLFKSDADIVEAVQKGVSEEGSKDEIEECTPPQMSWLEMARLSEILRSVCIGSDVKARYELLKVLRKFEAEIWAVELHKSTQQKLDVWLNVGASLLSQHHWSHHTYGYSWIVGKSCSCIFSIMHKG